MSYIRTNIYLSKKQKDEMKALAKVKDIRSAELVRRAIDEFLERQK
jgi:predicted transcriptional regulator